MSIPKNSLLFLAPRVLGVGVAVLTSVITARLLGPSGKGVLMLASLALNLLYLVSQAGLGASVTYHVSSGALSPPRALAFGAFAALTLGGGVLAAALWMGPFIRAEVMHGVSPVVYAVALAALPALMLAELVSSLRVAVREFAAVVRYQIIASFSTLVVAFTVLVVMGRGLVDLVMANTLVTVAIALAYFAATVRRTGFSARIGPGLLRRLLSYGARIYAGSVLNYTALRLDMFVLNMSAASAVVGTYSTATTMAETLWYVDSSMGRVTMPEVVSRDPGEAAAIVAAAARNVLIIGIVGGGTLALIAPQLVAFLYGPAFLPAVTPLRILLPGVVAFGMARMLLQYETGQMGRPGRVSWLSAGMTASSIIAYLILVPRFHATGAAAASTIVYIAFFAGALLMFLSSSESRVSDVLVPRHEDATRLWALARSVPRSLAALADTTVRGIRARTGRRSDR